jgi:hypothetical protein
MSLLDFKSDILHDKQAISYKGGGCLEITEACQGDPAVWSLISEWIKDISTQSRLRPCVIGSLFRVPWPPEIGARVLLTQHKIDFQHSAFLLQI